MATVEIINKALATMNNHDWYWMMADYSYPAMDYARGNMRYFVELVASIKNSTIENALRELWIATYVKMPCVNFGLQLMTTFTLICGVKTKRQANFTKQRKLN